LTSCREIAFASREFLTRLFEGRQGTVAVIGTTARPSWGASTFSPSTALKTEIGGVIVPSP
jgi:hypothetical protein